MRNPEEEHRSLLQLDLSLLANALMISGKTASRRAALEPPVRLVELLPLE